MTSWSRRRECGSSKSESPFGAEYHGLAVDRYGSRSQTRQGLTDARKAVGPLMTAAGEQAHPAAFQAPYEAIAVVFDLVQPAGPVGGTRAAVGMHGSMKGWQDNVNTTPTCCVMARSSIGIQASQSRLVYPWLATNGRFLGVALLSIFSAIEPYHHPGERSLGQRRRWQAVQDNATDMFHRAHESVATCTSADVGGDDVGLRFIKRASREHRELYVGGVISPVRRRFAPALSRHSIIRARSKSKDAFDQECRASIFLTVGRPSASASPVEFMRLPAL